MCWLPVHTPRACSPCTPPVLLEGLGHGGVGHVYLGIGGAGGGELLAAVRHVQVTPQVGQVARHAETTVTQRHHLGERERERERERKLIFANHNND